MRREHLASCLIFVAFILQLVSSRTTSLSMDNLDQVLKSSQVVFVAFCADWCPFSRRLKPIWEEAAQKWAQEKPDASVTWAIVDSVQQADVADKYFVNKYPTMKVFVNGELISKEYRSTRSVAALTQFVEDQLKTAIIDFESQDALNTKLDLEQRNVIGYFKNRASEAYKNFVKIAALLKEECVFFSASAPAVQHIQNDNLVFKDPGTHDDHTFTGNFEDYDYLKQWLTDKCIPLVREVTFENVEELTEEGLPFLIFFRDPKDKDSDKVFTDLVIRELHDQKSAVNALLADGHKFAHPLRHLGKTAKDLPVLAIDSFQHMFLFPNMSELDQAGKLRQFVLDLHSGKLHKEFHETLDQRIAELQKLAIEQQQELDKDSNEAKPPAQMPIIETTMKPSIFKELKPSNKRYSILQKTEL